MRKWPSIINKTQVFKQRQSEFIRRIRLCFQSNLLTVWGRVQVGTTILKARKHQHIVTHRLTGGPTLKHSYMDPMVNESAQGGTVINSSCWETLLTAAELLCWGMLIREFYSSVKMAEFVMYRNMREPQKWSE